MTKKLVLSVDVHDAKQKQKALKAVSGISGVESLALDIKEKKLTVVGDVDPVEVVSKLRKTWYTSILTVGPAKEPEKKKEESKKCEDKKDGDKKKEDEKKGEEKKKEEECIAALAEHYKKCNPHITQYYHVYSCEEDPNSCVIC